MSGKTLGRSLGYHLNLGPMVKSIYDSDGRPTVDYFIGLCVTSAWAVALPVRARTLRQCASRHLSTSRPAKRSSRPWRPTASIVNCGSKRRCGYIEWRVRKRLPMNAGAATQWLSSSRSQPGAGRRTTVVLSLADGARPLGGTGSKSARQGADRTWPSCCMSWP